MTDYENTAFLKKAAFISVGLLIIPGLFGLPVLTLRAAIPHRNIPLFFVYEKRMDIFIMRGILRLVLK